MTLDDVHFPPITVESIHPDGIDRLKMAIIKDASDEYYKKAKAVMRHPTPGLTIDQEMRVDDLFFRSYWFKILTLGKIDGEYMIKALREKAKEDIEDERSTKRKYRSIRNDDLYSGDGATDGTT